MINFLGIFALLIIASCGLENHNQINDARPIESPQDAAEKVADKKKDPKPEDKELYPPKTTPPPRPKYTDFFNKNGHNGITNQDGDNYCKNQPDGPTEVVCSTGLQAPCDAGLIACSKGKSHCDSLISSCGLQNFLAGRVFPGGNEPTAIASGDFNGDGFADAALTNPLNDTISILLGDESGAFLAPTSIPIAGMPVNIATADINGDQILDLVTVNASSNNTNVCLGTGTGAFVCVVGPPTGNVPSSLALADLNGDLFLDLVVTNSGDNTMSVFFGNNDGTFAFNALYVTGSGPAAIAVGDLDNQNGADLVVVNPLSDNISVYLNSGLGTFSPGVIYGGLFNPSGVALGDFDSDSDLDVAVANEDDDSVTIFDNDGLGILSIFNAKNIHIMLATYNVCDNPSGIEARDLDQDGDSDLAISCFTGSATVLTNDNGVFSRLDYTSGSGAQDISISDVNGDTYLDLILSTQSDGVVVVLGSINGTFSSVSIDSNCLFAKGLALGDVDLDGDLDIAIACPGEGNAKIRLNLGDGNFGTSAPYLATGSAVNVALSDINGDTYPDFLILEKTSSELRVFFNDQNGLFSFNASYSSTLNTPQSMVVTDIGGDGDLDVVITNIGNESVSLLYNNGLGVFSTILNDVGIPVEPNDVATGNFDNLSGMDVVIPYTGSDLFEVRLSGGENILYPTKTSYPLAPGSAPVAVAVGDLNNDGLNDIAIAESGSDKVSVALNNPMSPGTFAVSLNQFDVGPDPISVILVDANLDGNLDIVAANKEDGTVTLVTLDGALNALSTTKYAAGLSPYEVVAGRLDADQDADLVTSLSGSDGMSISLNINP